MALKTVLRCVRRTWHTLITEKLRDGKEHKYVEFVFGSLNLGSARSGSVRFGSFSDGMMMMIIIIIIIIIIIQTFVRRTLSASELNLRRRFRYGLTVIESTI